MNDKNKRKCHDEKYYCQYRRLLDLHTVICKAPERVRICPPYQFPRKNKEDRDE